MAFFQQAPVVAIALSLLLAVLLYEIFSLVWNWNKKSDTTKSTVTLPTGQAEKRQPPWSLGDAIKFGFGFGMGMFLWAIFTVVISIFIIWVFASGAFGIPAPFSGSPTQVAPAQNPGGF